MIRRPEKQSRAIRHFLLLVRQYTIYADAALSTPVEVLTLDETGHAKVRISSLEPTM